MNKVKVYSLLRELNSAVYGEHVQHCDDDSCDINFAYNHRLTLWAAHLLVGAGDFRETQDAYDELAKECGVEFQDMLDQEMDRMCEYACVTCPACNRVMWYDGEHDNGPSFCANCGETMPEDEHEVTDDKIREIQQEVYLALEAFLGLHNMTTSTYNEDDMPSHEAIMAYKCLVLASVKLNSYAKSIDPNYSGVYNK